MDLITTPKGKGYRGQAELNAVAGQTLKIETSPDGEEILEVVVPAGKKWIGILVVDFLEEDI